MRKQVLLTLTMILVLICPCVPASAAGVREPLKLDGKTSRYDLQGYLEVYEDKTGAASIDESPVEGIQPNGQGSAEPRLHRVSLLDQIVC